MSEQRKYSKATVIDPDSLPVNLVSVEDKSEKNESRSIEVIDLAIQMIQLASKRGRVKRSAEEVFDEAA